MVFKINEACKYMILYKLIITHNYYSIMIIFIESQKNI